MLASFAGRSLSHELRPSSPTGRGRALRPHGMWVRIPPWSMNGCRQTGKAAGMRVRCMRVRLPPAVLRGKGGEGKGEGAEGSRFGRRLFVGRRSSHRTVIPASNQKWGGRRGVQFLRRSMVGARRTELRNVIATTGCPSGQGAACKAA